MMEAGKSCVSLPVTESRDRVSPGNVSLLCSSAPLNQMDFINDRCRRGNSLVTMLSGWNHRHDNERKVLTLNVLLLGDMQSGRSSVGNALIGGHEFQTGTFISGVSMTTEFQVLSRNFPRYFRRQGAESDLTLRVIDTSPLPPHPQSVHELCPEGVHVLVVVVRADRSHEDTHVDKHGERLFGPEWRRHALLIITHADYLEKAGLHPSCLPIADL
ncbi:unnamed protein product [Pleuronectes platessa]|uniref:AIG1-type G domain-containing protein n=1 Tax=Pleuronectes platessa TaxID=8262 RepID=A0A9N7V2K8_PLEPL|nr:unnamed protein product [Pleuronectes platessa]